MHTVSLVLSHALSHTTYGYLHSSPQRHRPVFAKARHSILGISSSGFAQLILEDHQLSFRNGWLDSVSPLRRAKDK